ncbi:MAG: hypothetical protein H0W62_00800 [Chitinophagales bacterium]|nr:hypothetical protein [Chitinophagales bacterium]
MNTLKIFVLILLLPIVAWSQSEDNEVELKGPVAVAPVVLDSFQKAYPGMKNPVWDYGDGFFEVVFNKNGVDMTVDYDVYGRVQETESEIGIESLPQQARDYIFKNYSAFKLTSASKIVSANYDLNYVAQIGKEGKFWDITFDRNGKFMKEEIAD